MPNKFAITRKIEENHLKAFYKQIEDHAALSTREKFFLQLLNTKVAQVEDKEYRGRMQGQWLRIGALVISTLATVALGLKWGGYIEWLKWQSDAALVLSAVVTLLTAIANFLDVDGYRLHVRVMLEKLKILRYHYVYLLSTTPEEPPKDAEMDNLMAEFLGIVGDGYWEKMGARNWSAKDQEEPIKAKGDTKTKPLVTDSQPKEEPRKTDKN